jgi:hypothetical protein
MLVIPVTLWQCFSHGRMSLIHVYRFTNAAKATRCFEGSLDDPIRQLNEENDCVLQEHATACHVCVARTCDGLS